MRSHPLLLLSLLACARPGHRTLQAPGGAAVGFMELAPTDPLTGAPLKAVAFYPPAAAREGFTEVGPYRLEAERGLPIAGGLHPLVLLSHGHLGSRFGHHDLAAALARAGYIAAAVQHAGDSFDDASAFGTDRSLLGRAYQLSALLDAVLADSALGPHVDPSRVGAAGFSAGGYTALLAVGARPDFSLAEGYCQRHPADREICSVKEMKRTLRDPKPTADPRIKAAFAMAPLGIFFDKRSFDEVRAPVFLAWAQSDRVLLPEENAERVRRGLSTLAGTLEIAAADHFIFLAPCTERLANQAPVLCEDPFGVDRVQIHRRLADEARRFFDQALGG